VLLYFFYFHQSLSKQRPAAENFPGRGWCSRDVQKSRRQLYSSRWVKFFTMLSRSLFLLSTHKSNPSFYMLVPAGETWGQLLIFSSVRVSLLLATWTLREGGHQQGVIDHQGGKRSGVDEDHRQRWGEVRLLDKRVKDKQTFSHPHSIALRLVLFRKTSIILSCRHSQQPPSTSLI